uniref:DUF726 domain-containing protein n=1 Tax=Rhabditophanes sp. KR3021 TaxID=114890 RepID=A0AC35U7Z7_9BILA
MSDITSFSSDSGIHRSSLEREISTDSLDTLKAFDFEAFDSLPAHAKFSFASLLTNILHLDFYENGDEETRDFSLQVLKKVEETCKLPYATNQTLYQSLKGNTISNDPTVFITNIKEAVNDGYHDVLMPICNLLTSYLEGGVYDARFRVFLRHVCALLAVNWETFENAEDYFVKQLTKEQYAESKENIKVRLRDQKIAKIKRVALISVAGGIGGILIGLTGGLAAPLVASGASAIIGTSVATAGLASATGATIFGTVFGVAGGGLASFKMNKRVGNIEQFEFVKFSDNVSLHTVITVSGWINRNSEICAFTYPWRNLRASNEQYALVYESRYLLELGNALSYLVSGVVSAAVQQTLMETALHGILTAIAWPVALISVAAIIDNPWNVCIARSVEIGFHLAETLIKRVHGQKPVTLIGYSLGARVIFYCLLKLSERKNSRGIIENVILLGAPVTASQTQWEEASKVVSGRIINGYCKNDWMLKFLYRTMSAQMSIAGIAPVKFKNSNRNKVANYNLSHIVKGHLDYAEKLEEILDALGVKIDKHEAEAFELTNKEDLESISIRN